MKPKFDVSSGIVRDCLCNTVYVHYRHDGVYQGETLNAPLISILAGCDLGLDVQQSLLDDCDERLGRDKGSVDVGLRDVRLLAEHVGRVVEARLVEITVKEKVDLISGERHGGLRGESSALSEMEKRFQ